MTTSRYSQKRIFFDLECSSNAEALLLMPAPVIEAPSNYKDPEKIAEYIATKTAEAKAAAMERAPLDPDYGRILSLGLSYGDFVSVWVVGEPFGPQPEPEPVFDNEGEFTDGTITYRIPPPHLLTEAELIGMFWQHFTDCGGCCVGYNILGFDLPYLLRRSMALGVRVPLLPNLAKFRTEPVTDLMAILYNWGSDKYKGLKQVARLYGIPNDCPDVDGSKVKDLTPDQLREYQASDVKLVMELYKRMNGVYFKH